MPNPQFLQQRRDYCVPGDTDVYMGMQSDKDDDFGMIDNAAGNEIGIAGAGDSTDGGHVRATIVSLPVGYLGKPCPRCGEVSLTGAVITDEDGETLIKGADEADPSILCLACGHWWD